MADDRIKRPSFQWYPGDARRDTAFQACSFEARALWREMLDLMHDGEPYGHLTAGGVPFSPCDLARLVGKPTKSVEKWMLELESRKVFSRTDAGVIYSRRMVKDEHIRTVRAQSGRLGGNPNLLNQNGTKEPSKTQPLSTATAFATASAKEVVDAGAYALALVRRANTGLSEHPTNPQSIPRILASQGASLTAAELLIAAGVPLDFAEAQVYQLARSHGADGDVVSLKYFVAATIRAWEQFTAEANAPNGNGKNGNHRPGIGGRAYLTTLDAIKDV